MLIVLLKKTDYNTRVVAIDTKISILDGKSEKKFFSENIIFDGGDGFQVYLSEYSSIE